MHSKPYARLISTFAAINLTLLMGFILPVSAQPAGNPEVKLHPFPNFHTGERILIFAPHEDDEMLGCGGLMQHALAAGAHLHIVLMTNGDYHEKYMFFKKHPKSPEDYIQVGYT
jgi:hypothetical protein